MKRREFIAGLGGAVAWPLATRAQRTDAIRRVGVLLSIDENDPQGKARLSGFVQEFAKLGWTEGRNMRMDVRWAAGNVDRLRIFAKELVVLQPDVIFTAATSATTALQRETRTIPIVFVNVSDPVGSRFVASLSRPGGNMTGFQNFEAPLREGGSDCSRRSRQASSGSRSCSILTCRLVADQFSYPHSRQQPGR